MIKLHCRQVRVLFAFGFFFIFPLFVSSASAMNVKDPAKEWAFRWNEYCTLFHDPENNNGWSACPNNTPGTKPNADTSPEDAFFPRNYTLDLTDEATRKAVERVTFDICDPGVYQKPPKDFSESILGRWVAVQSWQIQKAVNICFKILSMHIGNLAPVVPSPTPDEEIKTPEAVFPPPTVDALGNPLPPPDPIPTDPPPPQFDMAIGDGIAAVVQRSGNLEGGQCPDNAKQSCGFFKCDKVKNLQGSTCIGRPASAVLAVINNLGSAGQLQGRNVFLSSGLSNQASDCANGTSPLLEQQVQALLSFGVSHVVVAGAFQGKTRGENPINLAQVDTCISNTIGNGTNAVRAIGGFNQSPDHFKPADPAGYLGAAETALAAMGATSQETNPSARPCGPNVPEPCLPSSQ